MGQGGHGGVAAHHLLVREHVGTADVEGAADLGRHGGAADEVAQDVADRDGLDARADPAGGDHDGEAFGQVAQHFEGGRAGTDDDGGAQDGGRHPGAEEDLADLGAGAQVRGEVAYRDPGRGEPAEVDDAADAGRTGLFREDAGGGAVAVLESGSGAEGVDEVVGDVDAAQGRRDGLGVDDVTPDDLGVPGPRVVAQLLGGPGQAPDAVSGVEELGHQAAPDVSAGPGDQAVQTGGGLHRSLRSLRISPLLGRTRRKGTALGHWYSRGMAVDELDTRILRLLIEQPRTSVREYARILGVARGTLQARLDRLERTGVITGAGPALSPAALGHPVLAFVHIEVTQGHLDEVGDALAAVPEIIEAFSITGGGDLLTRVAARDNAHLEDVIQQLIRLPGVVRTRTEVALRERVAHRLLPLVESVGRAARKS